MAQIEITRAGPLYPLIHHWQRWLCLALLAISTTQQATAGSVEALRDQGVLSATTPGSGVDAGNNSLGDFQRFRAMPIDSTAPPEVLLQNLWLTEGRHGPYSPELIPGLTDLGAAYFAGEEWGEAIETYGRAIHLQRLNEGLYTPNQTGMIEQIIEAYLQLGDYKAVDDKQEYLFRVQSQFLSANDPRMVETVERFADWQRDAYLGHLDRARYPRIVRLMDLYIDMANAAQGESEGPSRGMLPYLDGRLRSIYLASLYTGENEDHIPEVAKVQREEEVPDLTRLRFNKFYKENFRNGLRTIDKMRDVLEAVDDATPEEFADVEVRRGDWYQWNRQYALAIAAYEKAWAMMAGQPAADQWQQANFGAPRELPSQPIFSQGLIPMRVYNKGMLHARFEVTRLGEAKGIDIMAPSAEENQPAVTRGYQFVRNMRFRPRVEDGKVVESSDVERIYSIRY